MTGAYTRRGVVVLVVLAVGLSVAAPAMGAATVSQDDGSTTTFGDGLDDSTSDSDDGTTTSDSTTDGTTGDDDSSDGLLDDPDSSDGDDTSTSDDESAGDGTDDTDDSDGFSFDDGSDGDDTDDSDSADSTFGGSDDTNDSAGAESEGSSDAEQYDWTIPNMTSTTRVAGTETTMVLSPDELGEGSLAPAELVDVDRTAPEFTSEPDATLPTATTYELEVADLSTSDPGPFLSVETSGDTVASTSTTIAALGSSMDRVGDSLTTDVSTAPTSEGRSRTTAASLDAARVRDGADRTTGATGGANGPERGPADVEETGGSTGDGSAAADARQPGRQALDLGVPTGDLPVPSGPAGVGMAVGATALVAVGIRQSAALSGMASGVATSVGTAASTVPGSSAVSRLVRMLAPFRYSRYDDSDPLEHEARDAMFEVVEASPGTYLSEIADRADIPLSTARHHIRVLEREDLVSGAKVRGKRRFYPAYTEGIELAAAMNDESTAAVIDALARLGAASVSDLADELGRDPSTVSHHVQRLEEDDVVVRERDGRTVMNKLSAAARTALDPEESPSDSPTAGEAMASD